MNAKPVFFGLILVLLLVAAASLAYRVRVQQQSEGFTSGLTDGAFEGIYKMNGIEKCHSLSIPSVTASNLIDTGRLREWKPTGEHPAIRDVKQAKTTGHDFCYYYMDDDKQILQGSEEQDKQILAPVFDPLAANSAGACSTDPASGSLWSMFPNLIKDAFVDKERDANHKLPYKKCVLKMAAAGPEAEAEKRRMWDYVGEQNMICKASLDAVQKEYNTYMAALERIHGSNEAYRSSHGTREALSANLRACTTQCNDVANTFLPRSQELLQRLQSQIVDERSALDTQVAQAHGAQVEGERQWRRVAGDLVVKRRALEVGSEALGRIQAAIDAAQRVRQGCRQHHSMLAEEVAKRTAVVDALRQRYNAMERDYFACKAQLEKTLDEIGAMEKEKLKLDDHNKNLVIEVAGCKKQKQVAIDEEAAWRAKATTLRLKYEECSKVRAHEQATYEGHVARADALTAEIEDIKKRCRTTESEFYKANLETARDQAAVTIDSARAYCGNVSAMKAKKIEIMDSLCALNAQVKAKAATPPRCDEATKLLCCAYKAVRGKEIGIYWKNKKREGHLIKIGTSAATIDRIREAWGASPSDASPGYFTFKGKEFNVWKIVKTDRNTGVDAVSYYWVEAVGPSLGTIEQFEALYKFGPVYMVNNPPPANYAPPGPPIQTPPIGLGDGYC